MCVFIIALKSQDFLTAQYNLFCTWTYTYPFKGQLSKQLQPAEHSQYRTLINWVLEQPAVYGDLSNKIFQSDETHYSIGDTPVNKTAAFSTPRFLKYITQERPLHPKLLSVCCDLRSGDGIGPLCNENGNSKSVSVNLERFDPIITDFFACS